MRHLVNLLGLSYIIPMSGQLKEFSEGYRINIRTCDRMTVYLSRELYHNHKTLWSITFEYK